MSPVRAVLFDLDGVLVDAREWHYEALNRALLLFGYEINRFEHLSTYDGRPTRDKLDMLSTTKGLPLGLHELISELKQRYTKELIAVRCFPVFDIQYAVRTLRREGYALAVCTNSIRQSLDLMLERSALSAYFDLTLSNEDVSAAKPDPEIYLSAIERLGLVPDQCLIVEDNAHGLEAALASGARVLRVADPGEVTHQRISAALNGVGLEETA